MYFLISVIKKKIDIFKLISQGNSESLTYLSSNFIIDYEIKNKKYKNTKI